MTTPLPPFWASLTASSIPKMRYGLHVQMSEQKTSLPLHCQARQDKNQRGGIATYLVVDAQGKLLGRVGHVCRISEAVNCQTTCGQSDHIIQGRGVHGLFTGDIPIGGRNTLMSDRVIN